MSTHSTVSHMTITLLAAASLLFLLNIKVFAYGLFIVGFAMQTYFGYMYADPKYRVIVIASSTTLAIIALRNFFEILHNQ